MALASYKYNLLFIHIFKNAGTSIRESLAKGGEEILTGHATAADVRQALGVEQWEKLYSFAVIRNPFDWMVSLYNYIRAYQNHFMHQAASYCDINDFIEFYVAYSQINPANKVFGVNKTVSQSDFICVDGKVIINQVCRFEHLEQDMEELQRRKGVYLPPLQRLNVTAGTEGAVGREAYNEKGINLMLQHYAKDFELGSYQTQF